MDSHPLDPDSDVTDFFCVVCDIRMATWPKLLYMSAPWKNGIHDGINMSLHFYLHQGGYVFIIFSLYVSSIVQNFFTDYHKICGKLPYGPQKKPLDFGRNLVMLC